jgi:hypothetical protein
VPAVIPRKSSTRQECAKGAHDEGDGARQTKALNSCSLFCPRPGGASERGGEPRAERRAGSSPCLPSVGPVVVVVVVVVDVVASAAAANAGRRGQRGPLCRSLPRPRTIDSTDSVSRHRGSQPSARRERASLAPPPQSARTRFIFVFISFSALFGPP